MMIYLFQGNEALYTTHSKSYRVGSIPEVMYPASGTTADYAKGALEIPYVYTIELRGPKGSPFGFCLPPEQIIPCAEEIIAFHVAAAKQVIQEFAS